MIRVFKTIDFEVIVLKAYKNEPVAFFVFSRIIVLLLPSASFETQIFDRVLVGLNLHVSFVNLCIMIPLQLRFVMLKSVL